MAFTAGVRLGPYEIIAPLGAGGMGEVYRARDSRLRRDVALKILPPEVAADLSRRARFEQEAHAAATLNHPNILSIYDVGAAGDVSYIASELVNGETLSAVIGRGPVPVRQLVDIAAQIADGLASAHAGGIVHRDLKPANVMITSEGRIRFSTSGWQSSAGPRRRRKRHRVIYTRVDTNAARLWISAVGGSAPIRATTDNSVGGAEFAGAWSPDGAWFVYLSQGQNAVNLMKVKTSGEGAPVLLKSNLDESHLPDWSRDGKWIVCGTLLISADGQTERTLKPYLSPYLAFSKDSRLLYGIRSENGQNTLFALDVASGAERVIGTTNGLAPLSNLSPSVHFSLAPDGSSLVYSTGLFRTSLWMLEGFNPPNTLASRLGWR